VVLAETATTVATTQAMGRHGDLILAAQIRVGQTRVVLMHAAPIRVVPTIPTTPIRVAVLTVGLKVAETVLTFPSAKSGTLRLSSSSASWEPPAKMSVVVRRRRSVALAVAVAAVVPAVVAANGGRIGDGA
jgi:hypothetical protein